MSYFGLQKFKTRLPFFISVEPANFCNLHCPECPVGNRKHTVPKQATFDIQLYQKLIDELKPTLFHVILYFQGEPLLHKNLYEMAKYAHDARIYTSTSTNAQFLTNSIANDIVASGLDKLIISVDGSTQEVYEKYRVGGKLQKALDGINYINDWKRKLKSVTPMIEMQFIVLKSNEHQMDEMKKLAKKYNVDRLVFKTAQLYDFENGHELLPTQNKYARYQMESDGKYYIKAKQHNRCWRMWSGSVINTQGQILPCCFDKSSEFSFGNIQENSFQKNWHNAKATDFRASIWENRKQFEMCRNCTNN